MTPKLFLFGSSSWSLNYLQTIEKKFKNKFILNCIISQNNNFKYKKIPILNSIDRAIKLYGVPNGFIICTNPKKNLEILRKILKFDKYIIIEKPLVIPKDIKELISIVSKKNYPKILVNHFHFFNNEFQKYLHIKNLESFHIKILDGNSGPYRDISPLIDWGPHALGIVSFFIDINNIKIKNFKKIAYKNKHIYNLYIKISDKEELKHFSILIGNNFKNKIRKIYFNKKHFLFDSSITEPNSKPLDNLLDLFYEKIISNDNSYESNTFKIAIDSTMLINIIEKNYIID